MTETRLSAPAALWTRAATVLAAIGLLGMIAAIGYGAYQVQAQGKAYALKEESLRALEVQTDLLRAEVTRIRTAPLNELVTAQAIAVPAPKVQCTSDFDGRGRDANGLCPGYWFLLWIDLPYGRRSEISRVDYAFGRGSLIPVRTGREPSNGFLIGYLGWWPWPTIPITVVPTAGEEFTREFPMEQALGWREGP